METSTPTLTPADRFNLLIDGVMQDIANVVGWQSVPIPVIRLLWRLLRNMRARFNGVVARLRAGTLPAPGSAPRRAPPRLRLRHPRPTDRVRCDCCGAWAGSLRRFPISSRSATSN